MKIALHPEAEAEYLEAVAYYEERQPGLGDRYTREMEDVFSLIAQRPTHCRSIEEDVRRCAAQSLPYGVLYTIEADGVFVIAVAHDRRRPGYWRARLTRPEPDA